MKGEINAEIVGISPSGNFINIFFRLDNGKSSHTFTGKQYRNYAIWSQFKVGDRVGGLNWKNEKKRLIDADSHAYLISLTPAGC